MQQKGIVFRGYIIVKQRKQILKGDSVLYT